MKYDFKLDMIYNNSLSIIAKQIRKGSCVLEFGPANGRLTKYMKEELECEIYLVEIDETAGRQALMYAEDLLTGDIEDYEWVERYREIKFDYIILADVLEHLHDPGLLLHKAKLLLSETGSILISVPNIAHNSVAINLINNKFMYTDTGLLDNTHIHFFTKDSLESILLEAGLFPIKKFGTYNEVGDNEIENTYHSVLGVPASFWKMRPYGSVYQYVYEVKTGKEYLDIQTDRIVKYYPSFFVTFKYDLGDNYQNELQDKFPIWGLGTDFIWEINVPPMAKSICVDIGDGKCVIENVKAEIKNESGKMDILYEHSNLDALEAGQYFFFCDNPQLYYKVNQLDRCQTFTFGMSMVSVDTREINLMYNTLIKVKAEYQNR
ncbi:class I SAM-dependent methyltransferase [Kineothrix sp. MB12-C1]|uniref:class I SAM-dependent methyltransferase n=1 Tax=Kineothrix sp. MB12-C1 TaxID=3070215 RepID=UPI0027D22A56|nr:class I SAM-dependent methyltransferase [Kineothrix sp. MB12-C1]WMC91701.1 class I SAM-dependent methyltransferase [Kineothrix sp. MB12-C1]